METDKREHARVRCEVDSSFKNLDGASSAGSSETIVQDISEGGIRFRANTFIPVHHKLLFRIKIPHQKSIEAVAQPTWIREIPSLNTYDIGAKFLSLSDEDKEIIREFASGLPFGV